MVCAQAGEAILAGVVENTEGWSVGCSGKKSVWAALWVGVESCGETLTKPKNEDLPANQGGGDCDPAAHDQVSRGEGEGVHGEAVEAKKERAAVSPDYGAGEWRGD